MQALRRSSETVLGRAAWTDRVADFDDFLGRVEPKLRVALVATNGPVDGAVALGDAMSWAWEHFDGVRSMVNPVGYLYRVGQSATRGHRPRPIPNSTPLSTDGPDASTMSPHIARAVNRLPESQRAAVMLVHAFGWSQHDVAELLGVSASTVHQALARGVAKLTLALSDHERPLP